MRIFGLGETCEILLTMEHRGQSIQSHQRRQVSHPMAVRGFPRHERWAADDVVMVDPCKGRKTSVEAWVDFPAAGDPNVGRKATVESPQELRAIHPGFRVKMRRLSPCVNSRICSASTGEDNLMTYQGLQRRFQHRLDSSARAVKVLLGLPTLEVRAVVGDVEAKPTQGLLLDLVTDQLVQILGFFEKSGWF